MPKSIDEIRKEACYRSEEEAKRKPLLVGEACQCSGHDGCFKFSDLEAAQSENAGRIRPQEKTIWPVCTECGEKHPPLAEDVCKDIIERAKSAKLKKIASKPATPGTCQWPNPCKADCFEDHGKNMTVKKCEDNTCLKKICSDMEKAPEK